MPSHSMCCLWAMSWCFLMKSTSVGNRNSQPRLTRGVDTCSRNSFTSSGGSCGRDQGKDTYLLCQCEWSGSTAATRETGTQHSESTLLRFQRSDGTEHFSHCSLLHFHVFKGCPISSLSLVLAKTTYNQIILYLCWWKNWQTSWPHLSMTRGHFSNSPFVVAKIISIPWLLMQFPFS